MVLHIHAYSWITRILNIRILYDNACLFRVFLSINYWVSNFYWMPRSKYGNFSVCLLVICLKKHTNSSNMFARVCAMVSNLFTCGKHLHDRIISLWWEAWDHKTSFIPPFFVIALHAPSQESEQSCICVLGVSSQESEQSCICVFRVSILPLSTIFLLDIEIILTVWYFLISHFIT